MDGFRSILKNKNFLFFLLGQIISQFGDRLNQMALIGLVYSRIGGSAFGLAKVMSFTIIPSFLISPIAGAYVDRWNRKYTMIITDIIRAILVLLIPLCFVKFDSFIPVYIIVFFVFSTSCFFLPSKFSIIPELVPKEKLLMANSLTNTTMMIAAVLGVGLGGPLIEKVGAKIGFRIDSATYIFSAVLLCFISIKSSNIKKEPAHKNISEIYNKSIFFDIKEGIKYVFAHPDVRFVFSTVFMLMSAAGAIYIVTIVFIQQVFGSVTRDLGFLSVFLGLGFFLGALLCGRFGNKVGKVRIIFLCLILSGVFIGCFVVFLKLYSSLIVAAVIASFIGLTVGPIFISGNTLIHEVIKAEMRGRIFSSLGIVMNLGFLVFMFMASKLSELFNPMWIILAISLCFIVNGLYGLLTFKIKR